jgi:hypothetical protein
LAQAFRLAPFLFSGLHFQNMSNAKGGSRGRISPRKRSSAHKVAQAIGLEARHRGDLGEVAFVHKATSLGLVVAKPYGQLHRYDFIVDGGGGLLRVQVKACARMKYKLYQAFICRREDGVAVAYTKSEVDFVAVYIIPEDTWYILPVREVVGRRTVLFRPKGCLRPDPYACYREAWHLLRQPDGLTFG